ncbi:hypothetical protein KB205_09270 [Microvirga sp. STS03]|uniref:Uncharacterized protein n=1 Tax=Pontibacter populi TaxID=890055 RepID=A0ABS6XB68_9BACT|nr:hypothetical protein [Microvirga sp. STS03]MBW3365234.1 hypothetical protein [Pontibacter populi]
MKERLGSGCNVANYRTVETPPISCDRFLTLFEMTKVEYTIHTPAGATPTARSYYTSYSIKSRF